MDVKAAVSGWIKFVASMTMYTAGATKLGEAGLGWIDDRYIAQLSLRGRYQEGGSYPLESLMMWAPPSLRALGMLTVLVMELASIFSWWDFGRHYRVWIFFQIGSTLSIGVPILPQVIMGPLWPVVSVALDHVRAHSMVVIFASVTAAIAVLRRYAFQKKTMLRSRWTKSNSHTKRE